jgi:regulator of protease activity HflC (stomatin/prohibitin superfamily)
MCFTIVNAPNKGLVYQAGRPIKVLDAGFHILMPWQSVRRISTALVTQEVDVDVITRGGTPTTIKVGFTARVTEVQSALVNMQDAFGTLRTTVMSVVSGTANSYTIDQLAQKKNEIAAQAEGELTEASNKHGWGLGDFQIAIGDPSMSEELKLLLMREEAVRRESSANLEKAKHQVAVAQQLAEVAAVIKHSPFAQELLRLQMLADMGGGGKVIVVPAGAGPMDVALRES